MEKITRVFLIDDNEMLLDNYVEILALAGFDIAGRAENGRDALDFLQRLDKLPDVIILDNDMPVMNGTETLRRIRENFPETRVVYHSGSRRAVRNALDQGAHAGILKPCSSQRLIDMLRAIV